MKKIMALLVAGIMVFSLVSCGEKTVENSQDDNITTQEPAKESEILNPTGGSTTVGSYTLTAEFLPFEEPFESTASGDPDMSVFGDTVYISDGGNTVKVYTLSDSSLTYVKTLDIPCRNGISADMNGNIYADGGIVEAKIYDADGNETGKAVASGKISLSKTEDFALTFWSGGDEVTKIAGGAQEPWVITGMNSGGSIFKNINKIEIQNGHVLVGGAGADKNLIAVYDTAGTQLAVSELSGSLPNAVCESTNGYISAAVGAMSFIAKDGSAIGDAEDSKALFGVDKTIWVRNMTPLLDGTVLVCASYSREDMSNQILVYKLSGF